MASLRVTVSSEEIKNLIDQNKVSIIKHPQGSDSFNFIDPDLLSAFGGFKFFADASSWSARLSGSLFNQPNISDKLKIEKITVHDDFISGNRKIRGIYQLGSAKAHVELKIRNERNIFELEMLAQQATVNKMLEDLYKLWLAIKTGKMDDVETSTVFIDEDPQQEE